MFVKQKTAYEMRISDWSSDVCSSDLGEGNVTFREAAEGVDAADFDAVIAVIGETPYAETNGDIVPSDTVTHSRHYPEDLAVLEAVAGKGTPVVTVFVSGRPLYANDLINLSDAFVAAWLDRKRTRLNSSH